MGYRFTTGKVVQSQPVKTFSNSRLRTGFAVNADGELTQTVTATRAVTDEERVQRRQSARESSGARDVGVVGVGDYLVLPTSLRDLYLTGAHGSTSQYPEILLTTPRIASLVSTATGLTTSPFIIDVNNAVKRNIERNANDIISTYGGQIGLNSTEYTQNIAIAKQYADLCLQTAKTKDRLIESFDVNNVNSQDFNQSLTIDEKPYQFLGGRQSVVELVRSLSSNFESEDLVAGSNTKHLAQIFKILYDVFILNKIDARSDVESTTLNGRINDDINELIRLLQELAPQDSNGRILETEITNIAGKIKNIDKITSLACILQRDLIAQSMRSQIETTFGITASTCQSALGNLIGDYKDFPESSTSILSEGFSSIDEILQYEGPNSYRMIDLLVRQTRSGEKFGILDDDKGVDLLVYQDIADQTPSVQFSQLQTFTSQYSAFAIKLSLFYQLMFKNDELRKFVAKRVSDAIISFINGSKIDTQNFSSTESSVRVGYLMLAACSDEVANKLFQFICSQDKINNYGETEERKLNFDDSLENLADIAGDRAYTNEGDVEATEFSLADTEEMVIRKSYLTGVNISFQDFHNIARSLENEFAPGQLDVVSSDIRAYTTNYSLSISRDARAFVFFQMFLTILRRMYFEVTTNSFAYDEIRVRHKFNQFFALKLAAKYYDYNLEDFTSAVTNEVNSSTDNLIISSAPQVVNDALMFYNRYFRAMIAKSTAQEQTCLDLVNIVAGHARKIENLRASLKTGINSVKSTLAQNQMSDLESVLNATQLEQAILKKNIVDRYSKSLLGAEYLPAAIDHNVNQSNNLRTAILTNPVLSDPLNNTATRQFYVAIGIPSGLLETLRYNNSNSSTDEHLFSIDLIFRNLQRTELQEAVETQTGRTTPGATPGTDRDTEIGFASKSYTFSTRIFVREGSREDGGPDVTSSQLTSYPQIATSSKFKILDDDGNYTDVDYSTLDRILGSQVVINNHLLSHYGKLYLKSVSGINLDEEIFDIVPQERTYPDVNKLSAYSTLEDLSANIFGATAEDQLNRVRLLQDLARSRQLAPQQHKLSMMVSKTFERIHVIPVDLTEILSSPGINLPDADIAFIDVVAKIRLLDDQIPVTRGARSSDRSFVNSLGASGDGRVEPVNLSQFSASSQSVASVGISNIVETSNRFGGRLGGYSR